MSKNTDVRISVWVNDKTGGKTLRDLSNESKKLSNELAQLPVYSEDFRKKAERLRDVKMGMAQIKDEVNGTALAMQNAANQTESTAAKLQKTNAETSKSIEGSSLSWGRAANGFNKYFGIVSAGLAVITGLVFTLKNWVDGFEKLSDAQADVAKTTDLTNTEIEQLMENLKSLNTRTSRTELLKLAEEAGRLGKKSVQDVMDFVKVADKIKVALGDDLGGDDALREVGKLAEVYRVGQKTGTGFGDAMLKLGSAINEVSASGANQAGFLVDYLKRLAGISSQTTLTAEQQIGFAAVFDETGQQVETSATAMSQVIANMYKDTATYANIAGMSTQQFSQLLNTDTNAALVAFLKGLNGNNEGLQIMAQKMQDLGLDGTRVVATLSAVASNLELVETRQRQASDALIEGISITEESDKKNKNFAANMERIGKALYGAFINSSLMRGIEKLSSKLVEMVNIPVSETIEKERVSLIALEFQLYDTNTPLEKRKEIIEELKKNYPGYFSHLDTDKSSNEDLSKAILMVNQQLINKISLMRQNEKIEKNASDISIKQEDLLIRETKLREGLIKAFGNQALQVMKNKNDLLEVAYELIPQMEKTEKGYKTRNERMMEIHLRSIKSLKQEIALLQNEGQDIELFRKQLTERFGTLEDLTQKLSGNIHQKHQQLAENLAKNLGGNNSANDLLTEFYRSDFANWEQFQLSKIPIGKVVTEEQLKAQEKYLTERVKAEEKIHEFLTSLEKDKIEQVRAKYNTLIELAKKYKLDYTELEKSLHEEIAQMQNENFAVQLENEQTRLKSLVDSSLNQIQQSQIIDLSSTASEEKWPKEKLDQEKLSIELEILNIKREAYLQLGFDIMDIDQQIYDHKINLDKNQHETFVKTTNEQLEMRRASLQLIGEFERSLSTTVTFMRDLELSQVTKVQKKKWESEEEFTKRKEEEEQKRKDIVKKYAFAEALMRGAQVIGTTAEAVMKAAAASPLTLGMPWAAILKTMGGIQIAVAFAQAAAIKGYSEGGFTSRQGLPDPKIINRRITGYVHDNEYVVDTATMYEPDVWPLVQYIEARRTGQIQGFNNGGFTNTVSSGNNDQALVTSFSDLGGLMKIMISQLDKLNDLTEIKDQIGKPSLAILDNEEARKLRLRIDNEIEMENRSML